MPKETEEIKNKKESRSQKSGASGPSEGAGLFYRAKKEANQFRLLVHSGAYVLMHTLRKNLLKGSQLAKAQFDTVRLRLLKIVARVELGKTFIRFHLPALPRLYYPFKGLITGCRLTTRTLSGIYREGHKNGYLC
jgi:hypothetical protein